MINATTDFSCHQITAGNKVIECFDSEVRWVVEFAQPQSGKSDTFYFVAAEYLRRAKIQHVVIFSGNTEKELGEQVKQNKEKFLDKYDGYLEETMGLNRQARAPVKSLIRERIVVRWGADLEKDAFDEPNTLYIWEESHSAQDKGMRVDKFFRRVGISGNGDVEKLAHRNNYFLSVSATPFSEISDIVHEEPDQFKRIVRLNVDHGYYGLEKMLTTGRIRGFDSWKDCLETAIHFHDSDDEKYCIIRVRNDAMGAEAEMIARRAGYDVKFYNSDRKDIASMDSLSIAPLDNTLIIIKGMCRMGRVVPKMHISFCMETSTTSNTDVVLQGLLGRMFGWHTFHEIVVYIHNKILNSGELERYVQFVNGSLILPRKANNLVKCKVRGLSGLYPIVPIRISRADLVVDDSEDYVDMDSKAAIIESIKAAFASERVTQNLNDPEQKAEILEQILNYREEQFEIRRVSRENTTYKKVAKKIMESVNNRTPQKLGSSCGIREAGNEIKIYYFPETREGIHAGDLFIDARTLAVNSNYLAANQLKDNVAPTTKHEVFCHREESAITVICNGTYPVPFPIDSCVDLAAMENGLRDIIALSTMETSSLGVLPRRLTSNQTEGSRWQGIIVDEAVLCALKKGGQIYESLKQDLRIKLKFKKASGCMPRELRENGYMRLSEISW